MTWQPIETAPFDSENVDIWAVCEGHGQRWPDACYDADYYDENKGAWLVECQSGPGPLADGWEITHWMRVDPPS